MKTVFHLESFIVLILGEPLESPSSNSFLIKAVKLIY